MVVLYSINRQVFLMLWVCYSCVKSMRVGKNADCIDNLTFYICFIGQICYLPHSHVGSQKSTSDLQPRSGRHSMEDNL